MTQLHSKSFLLSATIWLGFSEVLIAAFQVAKDYQLGGFAGVQEAHFAGLIIGMGVIANRIRDDWARPLHVKPRKLSKADKPQ